MAWNEPGNRDESPWGKKRPAGKSGGLDETLKSWQQKLLAALGGGPAEPPSGQAASDPSGSFGLIMAAAAVVLWIASGFYQIDASERGVVQRFGRFSDVRQPGVGMVFPWPIERITKVNVSKVNSAEYKSRVLTGDVNLVDIGWTVQYQDADPVKVLFQVKDVSKTLIGVSESALREVMGQSGLDDVLGVGRQRITANTKELIQKVLDSYNTGIHVTAVNLTDVQVPDAVIEAQRDANKAIEDKERYSKEAQAYANDILPKAAGEAQRRIQDAEAYKAQVVALAEGDAARFNSVLAAYQLAPEVTRQRMYVETVEYVMQRSKKVVLDAKGGSSGNMLYLPLDKLLEQGGVRSPTAPSQSSGGQVMEELPTVTVDGRSRGVR